MALEDAEIEGFELQQLVHGNYRILFVVVEARVHVLHIRHAARRPADRAQLETALGEDLSPESG